MVLASRNFSWGPSDHALKKCCCLDDYALEIFGTEDIVLRKNFMGSLHWGLGDNELIKILFSSKSHRERSQKLLRPR